MGQNLKKSIWSIYAEHIQGIGSTLLSMSKNAHLLFLLRLQGLEYKRYYKSEPIIAKTVTNI